MLVAFLLEGPHSAASTGRSGWTPSRAARDAGVPPARSYQSAARAAPAPTSRGSAPAAAPRGWFARARAPARCRYAPRVFEIDVPTEPSSVCLDGYLENGWFRSGALMTRTPLLPIAGEVWATLPMRVDLDGYRYPKGMRRVLRRNEGRLRSEVGTPRIDAAREALYQATRVRFMGYQLDTLEALLGAGRFAGLFETREITVWDDDQLVAASYFDVGRESIASLLAVYDQTRRREGLGIYTMLLEIGAALAERRRFYYPGYVLIGNPRLDYKLRLGNVQYRAPGGCWRPGGAIPERDPDRERLYRRIASAEGALERSGIRGRRRVYPLFWLEQTGIAPAQGWRSPESPLLIEVGEGALDTGAWFIDYRQRPDTYVAGRASICQELRELGDGAHARGAESRDDVMAPLAWRGETIETRHPTEAARWLVSLGAA